MALSEDECATLRLGVFTDDCNPEVLDRYLCIPFRRVVHRGERLGPANVSRKNKWEYEICSHLAEAELVRERFVSLLLDKKDVLNKIAQTHETWIYYSIDTKERQIVIKCSRHQVHELSAIGLCWCLGFGFHVDCVDKTGERVSYAPDFYDPEFPDFQASARFTLLRSGSNADVVEVLQGIYDEWTEPLERFIHNVAVLEPDPRDESSLLVQYWTNSDQMGLHLTPEILKVLSQRDLGLEIIVFLCPFEVVFPGDDAESTG